jgi:hypothetical protein
MSLHNEELNIDKEKEPAYRPPKVQNFRTLQGDLIHTVKEQDKSLTEIILSAKKDRWEEEHKEGGQKKVFVENKYRRPLYKIIFLSIVIFISILINIRLFFY